MPGQLNRNISLNKFRKPAGNTPSKAGVKAFSPDQVPSVVSRERRAAKLQNHIENVPSLNNILTQILQLCNSPNTTNKDFEKCISSDQGLTVRLLKMINSSYFGLRNKVNTISHAVGLLGISSLKSIVTAATTNKLLYRNLKYYGYAKGGLWIHSLMCAGIARHLGSKTFKMGRETSEELFVAGLLHDVGKVAISPILSESQDEFFSHADDHRESSLCEVEKEIFGLDHAEVGEKLMKKWNLSSLLINGVRQHHSETESTEEGKFIRILQLSHRMTLRSSQGLNSEYRWHHKSEPSDLYESLGMSDEDEDPLFEELQEVFDEINALSQNIQ